VLGYELPWNQRQFHANFYLRLSKEQLDRKVKAIGHYQSQAHRKYMQEDFIRSLARVRGIQSGNDWAEAFTLYHLLA
jgi:LmbE family N-acetylglucosaminyl deacetylase